MPPLWFNDLVSRHLQMGMLANYDESNSGYGGSLPLAWRIGGDGAWE